MQEVPITFQLDSKDYGAFLRAVKSSPLRGFPSFVAIVLVLQGLAIFTSSNFRRRYARLGWQALIPYFQTVLITLVFFLLIAIIVLFLQKIKLKKSPLLAEPITITVDDQGISGANSKGLSTFFWPAVHQVSETDAHFFVLNAPRAGLIIPKRAFDSHEQVAEFSALLNRKWAQHHQDTAPIALPQ